MSNKLILVICKPGGTVNRVPVDIWAGKMRAAGYDVTVRDQDEMGRGGAEFDEVAIDEVEGWDPGPRDFGESD